MSKASQRRAAELLEEWIGSPSRVVATARERLLLQVSDNGLGWMVSGFRGGELEARHAAVRAVVSIVEYEEEAAARRAEVDVITGLRVALELAASALQSHGITDYDHVISAALDSVATSP
mgnify:CR=1 FL=1